MATRNSQKSSDKKCSICGKPVLIKFRPFCSIRCSQLDLSKWLNEDYSMPVVETDDFDEDEYEGR